MEVLFLALSSAFCFAILKWKLSSGRKADAVLDLSMTIILLYVLGDSVTGASVAIATSAMISVWLIFSPLRIPEDYVPSWKTIKHVNFITMAIIIVTSAVYLGLTYV